MCLGPLYLLKTTIDILGLGGQIYIIIYILSMANLVKGFDIYVVYKGLQMYERVWNMCELMCKRCEWSTRIFCIGDVRKTIMKIFDDDILNVIVLKDCVWSQRVCHGIDHLT